MMDLSPDEMTTIFLALRNRAEQFKQYEREAAEVRISDTAYYINEAQKAEKLMRRFQIL